MNPTDEQQEIIDVVRTGSDLVIEAGAGCLAADTIINTNRGGIGGEYTGRGKGKPHTIENVARQLAGNPIMERRLINGETIIQGARKWDLSIPTYVSRAEGDVSRLGLLSSAWASGIKRTYEVRTEGGRKIRATADHPFLVENKFWAMLSELDTGHLLAVNSGRSAREHKPKLQYRTVVTKFHPHQVNDSNTRVKFKVLLHRAIIEAELNEMTLTEFLTVVRTDAERSAVMHFLGDEWHVHHKDHNTLNNERSNLELLTETEHHALHAEGGFKNHVLWQIGLERIIAIRPYGEEPTFDIEVSDDPHNFLANGFVVHNTGKSSTLKMVALNEHDRTGLCIYFNRAPAAEARRVFPGNVKCSTAHSLAWHAMKDHPAMQRLDGPKVTAKMIAEDHLGISKWFKTPQGRKDISTWKIASMAVQAVKRFCYSDAEEIQPWHVERIEGVTGELERELRAEVLPFAREIWSDLQQGSGFAQFDPDHYMKMWALRNPVLEADFMMVDESQDTNGVLAGVVRRQDHLQRIFVGDSQQRLFSWRGTVDMMSEFKDAERRFLTQSFRFGDAVADEANRWLDYLESPLRLRGLPSINSRLDYLEAPDAILCRTNAAVIEQAMDAQHHGFDAGLVGGIENEISSFAAAVDQLRQTGKTSHRELSVFKTWNDVVAYVRDEQPGGSFSTSVRLIERYGTGTVRQVAAQCVNPKDADFVISTVHKVKGLEWPRVKLDPTLAPDDTAYEEGGQMPAGELMTSYVAVTRARDVLDATAVESFHRRRTRRREAKQAEASSI